ncbi:AMP-dependent synthetase/ligase, AMP-binding enzyme C-terminal domain protein [Artemisia annua]|uniref:AMP-dependent synthetase/ligase, AMP-binding enzyme C-terminal domain protein n=1 Tax=Artemisia annua TaxID=35608 RepID=A0A2U1NS99_ARTAN|nr:AMP-dependent synthetase/ligase, AMP-binding enzyme C-terminal domain protein [Artemisia annua]
MLIFRLPESFLNHPPNSSKAPTTRYPNEASGQVPMGFVVRRKDSTIDEAQVITFLVKQVEILNAKAEVDELTMEPSTLEIKRRYVLPWSFEGKQSMLPAYMKIPPVLRPSPHFRKKTPKVVHLLPGTPYNQQVGNCYKGGVINS